MPESLLKKKWHVLLISLCSLTAFLLLFIFRNADDNRLTSWQWAFADIDLVWFFPLIALGIIFTYALLKSPIARQRPSLFLFLISFASGAVFWKVPEVIVDASRYFTQAKHLEVYGISYFISEWGKNIQAWTDLPLVPFLYGLAFKFLGESRAIIQVFTTSMFSVTVVITYLIGRTLWDEDTGFLAGALLWGIPYVFSQIPLMLVDIPTMFFLTASIYTFIRALQKGGGWVAVSAVSVFCAVFSKYSAWIMLSALVVICMVHLIRGDQRSAISGQLKQQLNTFSRSAIVYRIVLVAFIAGLLVGIVFFFKFDVIFEQLRFLREYQAPGLRRWGESFTSTFLYQIHPFISIAALYSFYEALRRKDLKFLIISWLIILIFVFQIRRSRYVMVVFPMLALMASYGLQRIKAIEIRRYIASCIVGSSLVIAIFAYLPFLQSMSLVNLKNAGEFLESVDGNAVKVFTIPSAESAINSAIAVPILDLYSTKGILYDNDDNFSLPPAGIEKSPLRFTWAYKNPEYYRVDRRTSGENSPVVVISNRNVEALPERINKKITGYKKAKVFDTTTGLFKYSPVVTVYVKDDEPN